jgi:hypothetical protein
LRVWDRNSGQEIKRLDFPAIPSSMEVSKDGNVITTTHSNIVTFWDSKEYLDFASFVDKVTMIKIDGIKLTSLIFKSFYFSFY